MEPKERKIPEWLTVKILCPNCGRVVKVMDIKTDRTLEKEFKCKKCPLKHFEWKYYYPKPEPERNWYPRYGFIEIKRGIALYELPKINKYNEKSFSHSNK